MTAATPRVAQSRDDLCVGQDTFTIDRDVHEAWTLADEASVNATRADMDAGYVVVILSDPPPEPVTVSREAFEALAKVVESPDALHRSWSRILAASKAVVYEVRAAE